MPELAPELIERAEAAAAAFAPGRHVSSFERLGSGHIHATLRACYSDGGEDLVLQQLNEHVFPDLAAVTDNILAVTDHLRVRTTDPRRVLQPLRTRPTDGSGQGAGLVRDLDGIAWRAYVCVATTRAYDVVPTHELAERAARAFAEFAANLSDLDPSTLAISLPGFHDLAGRLGQLEAACARDSQGRAAGAAAELDRVRELGAAIASALASEGAAALPQRVVHNDCKVNNLLFDSATDEPLCVVDLDTVMPGPLLVDFGELVRTATCSAAEDERDLSLVDFDAERFAALARGYVGGLGGPGGFSTEAEVASLWLGGPWMAIENAARFLADHLDGDLYFPARRHEHNLVRSRAQLHLAEQFWDARSALQQGVAHANSGLS
jgi:aminoglycoside phosphotransferase (APT) family kinase protein